MATNANGVAQPAGSDGFDPVYWMGQIVSSLHGRIHILAANAGARTALAGTCGWTPTASDPLVVLQTDTQGLWTYDGTTWTPPSLVVPHARFTVTAGVAISATTWTSCPFNATVDSSTSPPYTLNAGARTITITQSGVYLISAAISASYATFALRITVGGVVVAQTTVAAGVSLTQSLDRCIRVTAGQAVTVDVYASTASGISPDSGTAPTSVSITQIGL